MQKNLTAHRQRELKALTKTLLRVRHGDGSDGAPTVIITSSGRLMVSAEDGRGFADYYGEFRGGYPWIAPELEQWAKTNGGYFEWQNAGTICFIA